MSGSDPRFAPPEAALRRFDAEASPEGYADLLSALLGRGFEAVWPEDLEPTARHLFIRHDVDLDLEGAVALAEQEARLGVHAVYFVLVGTPFYDPSVARGREHLRRIVALGHRIGLHFDPGPGTRASDPGLHERAAREADRLARAADRAVDMVAFHRPSALAPWVLGHPGPIAGRPHAYAPRWFDASIYVSDGAAHWSHGHPCQLADARPGRAMQLLTHPYLWAAPRGTSLVERVERLLGGPRAAALRARAREELRTYAHQVAARAGDPERDPLPSPTGRGRPPQGRSPSP